MNEKNLKKQRLSKTWAEREPSKYQEKRNKTRSKNSTASNAVHEIGLNNMIVQPKRKVFKLWKLTDTTQNNVSENEECTEK